MNLRIVAERNSVTATTIYLLRQHLFASFELLNLNVAQGADSRQMLLQKPYADFAIAASKVVFPRSQFVSEHAVTDDQTEIRRHRKQLM